MNGVFYIINVVLIGLLSFFVWKKSDLAFRKFYWPALFIKLLAGILLGLVYTYYYTDSSDTFSFFKDAQILAATAREDFQQYIKFLWSGDESSFLWIKLYNGEPRTLFFIKGLSLVSIITSDNYWISSLWLSFISFLGCGYLFVQWNKVCAQAEWPLALSLFFFPSFLFWGSGILKESVAIASLCYIIGVFLLWMNNRRPSIIEWIILVISLYILWNLKYYWAAVLTPTLVTTLIVHGIKQIKELNTTPEVIAWLVIFLTLCLGVSFVHPNFYPERLLLVIVDNYNLFTKISDTEAIIHFYHLQPDWISILVNAPWALISGLFRPFVFESNSVLQIIAGMENLIMLVFFLFSIKRFRLITHSPIRLLIYGAIVYVTLLCIFLAISTPNFGTLSRYRIGFLPVFCFLIFYENPLWNKLRSLRKYF